MRRRTFLQMVVGLAGLAVTKLDAVVDGTLDRVGEALPKRVDNFPSNPVNQAFVQMFEDEVIKEYEQQGNRLLRLAERERRRG